jgi:hypothetical protein
MAHPNVEPYGIFQILNEKHVPNARHALRKFFAVMTIGDFIVANRLSKGRTKNIAQFRLPTGRGRNIGDDGCGIVTPVSIFRCKMPSPMYMLRASGPAMFAPKSDGPQATIATDVTLPALASASTCISKSMQAREAGFSASSLVSSMRCGIS